MKHTSRLGRRLLAVAASGFIGLVGAVAIASPASAHHSEVSGACAWDAETSEWVVTWTVNSVAPAEVESYRLTKVEVTPEGTVDGIEVTEEGFPHDAHEPLVGEQRLPDDTTSASLTVRAEWDNGVTDKNDALAEVQIPAECDAPEEPELPEQLGEWSFDCDTLTITANNPLEENLTLTFEPSEGDAVDVEVAGGESATVEFPASEGLNVDVLVNGEQLDLQEPIQITSEAWAAADCEEDDGGEGGGLPETGASTGIIAGAAVALLALGGGLFLLARRRRVTFTA